MLDTNLSLYGFPGHLIRRCHQIVVAMFLEETRRFRVTPIQFSVLSATEACPGTEQVALAGMVGIDRSTIGNVLYRLEKRGLLRREADPGDRRIKRIFLAPKGSELLREILPLVKRSQDRFVQPLEDYEKAFFLAVMRRLVNLHNQASRAPLVKRPGRKA